MGNSIKRFSRSLSNIARMLSEDQITVYAAQAAFFLIVSAVPLTILIIGIARYIIDTGWLLNIIDQHLDGQFGTIITTIVEEIINKTDISLVSITILTVLWSASRGVFAVTRGVCGAYGVHIKENFLFDIIRSFIYTIVFIFVIIMTLLAMVFAETIRNAAKVYLPLLSLIFNIINACAPVILTVILTLFFALIFHTVSTKGRSFSKAEYKTIKDKMPRGFLAQLPGAGFAAVGWVIFSYLFSLYIRSFPNISYLYGSLTTLMFLMLWTYFCMFILLLGAELNKIIFNKWNIDRIHKNYVIQKKRRKAALTRVRTYSSSFGRKKKTEKYVSNK